VTVQELYLARGEEYGAAYEMLARNCEYPPSLEQFQHELMVAKRGRPMLTVTGMARRLSDGYHRVGGLFGGVDMSDGVD